MPDIKKLQFYLPVPVRVTTQTRQRRHPQVTGAPPGESLHEQCLVGVKVHNSNLVVQQLWGGKKTKE